MKSSSKLPLALFSILFFIFGFNAFAQTPYQALREKAQKEFRDANFKDAYNSYREYIFAIDVNQQMVGEDFKKSIN